MKNKKVIFLTTGTDITASSRVRVYNYKPLLENYGFRITIIPYNSSMDSEFNVLNNKRDMLIKSVNKLNQFFKCWLCIIIAPRYDVFYIQRVLLPEWVLGLIRFLSRKIIFDFDDAIYLADKWNKSFFDKRKFTKRFERVLKLSDHVVVANHNLREVASRFSKRVTVLPTSVDTDKLVPKTGRYSDGKILIGWIGSPWAVRYLEPLVDIFRAISKKYKFLKFSLIGISIAPDWGIDISAKEWSLESELEDLNSFNIGIMPLGEDEWSAGKSGYKLVQYMSVGIPCVASPVGINKEIVEEGVNGFLAKTPEEWLEKLSILIENEALRKSMGAKGREKAEKCYSYRANVIKLMDVLASLPDKSP